MQRLAKLFHTYIVLYVFAFAMVATIAFLGIRFMANSSATSFQAGNIMSDYVMSNYNSMTQDQIQAWLTAKNPCNNHNYNLYVQQSNAYNGKGYYWHWTGAANSSGHFVCISEERFDGTNIGSGKTAAEIIYQAAQDYKINPQVLLVLLQKEQGLITDTYPNSIQYRKATGYGCPDTAACDSKYYGLENQIRQAASLFRTVLDGGWSNYPAYSTVYVQYHPNASCSGTNVYIQNRATSALYRYTPYQPNSAALSGSGDTCSSYGNRNFYNYFTSWFGDTQTTPPTYTTSQYIPDGTYEILPRVNENNAVDLTNNDSTNGTNIQIYSRNSSNAQKWQFTYNSSDGTYTITNPSSGKVLDLSAASISEGTNIQLWESNNSCAQKWKIAKNSEGYYTFVSACAEYMVLDVSSGSSKSGANIQLWTGNETSAQQFRIITEPVISNGFYEISAGTNSNLSLDISNGALAATNGTNIQVYTSNQTQAQEWNFTYNSSDGTYTIANAISSKVIDVASGSTANGANIQAYSLNSTAAQKWIIIKNSDGTYSFYAAVSGKALDISDGSSKSGANVQQWTPNGTKAQKWTISSVDPASVKDGTYEIVSKLNNNLALDVSSGSTINGARLQIWTRNSTGAQKWQLTYNSSDDTYTIINPQSNKLVDLDAANTTSGTKIQIWQNTGSCAQRWKIARISTNYYTFVSSCSSTKVIDVSGGYSISGTKVQIWSSNKTNAQQSTLIPIEDGE